MLKTKYISSLSLYLSSCHRFCVTSVAWVDGYKVSCFLSMPLEMIMLPNLHPMNASTVANHGLPSMSGSPPKFDFGWNTKKSTRYSQGSSETIISSSIPSGMTFERSTNSRTIGVDYKFVSCNIFIVSNVITFIATPKSIRVFGIETLLIIVVTLGMPRSTYFSIEMTFDIKPTKFPITCIVCGLNLFLDGVL